MACRGSCLNACSSCWQCLVRIRKYSQVGGGITVQGFKVSKALTRHCLALCLAPAFGSDVKLSATTPAP